MSYKFNPFTQQLDYYEAKGLGGSSQITNLSLVFCESFTGDGGTTEFTLTGSLDNVTFSNGSWSLARVGDTLPSHATDENNAALYDSTNIFTKNRIQVDSINGLTGVVTLTEPPQFLEEFKIWYWYDLLSTNVLSFYRREDFVASMEGDISSGDTLPANDIALNISQFDSILSNADTDVQKAMDTLDDHTHVEADITDLAHYTSSDFDTDFSSKNTADLSEVTNLYYTELRVSSNTDVSSNTSARHTHANKTLLDSLISSGPGTNYLADDGTYNSIVVITDFISLTDTPSAYAGTAGQFVRVNATPDGLEFVTLDDVATSGSHTDLSNIGTNTHTQIDTHISNTESIYENVQEPSGFKPTLLSDSSLSVAPLTRTFTIAPTGADFEFWVKGVKYIKSVAQDVVFPDIEGIHYFYFDTTGTLATSQVNTDWFNIIAGNGATVSSILWDATNKEAIQISEERHGFMPGTTHILMHLAFGMQWISGGILSDILSDQSGDLDTHAQLGVTSVSVIDEDLLFDYTDGSPQTITSPAQIPVFYLTGASGNWRKKVADDYPFIHSGTAGYTGAGGRAAYNEWTGTVWQLTEVTNNNFFLAHIFATNDISEPIISIQGQNEYNTIIAARAGAQIELDNLHTVGLTSAEFTPIGTVILQTSNSYSNVPQSRIRTTDEGDDYIKWIGNYKYSSGGGGITDHSLLNGLANDDHLQYLLVDGTRAMTGALDMGTNNITNVGTVDGRDISTDGSTLDSHVGSSSNPHSTSIANIGSGTIAQLNSAISDATLDDSSDSRTPTTHATSHQNAGSDEISVIGLSGLLGDPQTPVQHALDSATYHSVPTDITTFNSTAAAHGFLPKLSGVSSEFLNGAGDWATPPGEVNTTSNIGLGYWMAKSKVGVDLPFRSIAAGDNIIIDSNPNDITINARPTSEYVAEVWRGESKAEIVNGVGLLCKVAIDQANPPGGVPLTGTGLDHIDGLIAPYTTTTTVNIVKIHILVARCATDTGTVGTAPTIRLDIYSHTNTSRTLLETVRVPVTTGVSSIATNDSLAGTGNYIIFSVDLTASAIGIVQNSLIGFEFVNESGEDAINSLSRPTVSMNVQSGALAP